MGVNVCIVLQEDGEELFDKHVDQWIKSYQQASMEIGGNLKLVSYYFILLQYHQYQIKYIVSWGKY